VVRQEQAVVVTVGLVVLQRLAVVFLLPEAVTAVVLLLWVVLVAPGQAVAVEARITLLGVEQVGQAVQHQQVALMEI